MGQPYRQRKVEYVDTAEVMRFKLFSRYNVLHLCLYSFFHFSKSIRDLKSLMKELEDGKLKPIVMYEIAMD